MKATGNRRLLDFDPGVVVLIDRCHDAEECVKALLALIAGDQGEFLASHSNDWKRATEALLKP